MNNLSSARHTHPLPGGHLGLECLSATGKLCSFAASSGFSSPTPTQFGVVIAGLDAAAVQALAQLLKPKGYSVHHASSEDEAVIITKARRPRVVIIDLSLSEEDGDEPGRRIKAVCPNVQVVLATDRPDLEKAARDAGRATLRKPLHSEDLEALLKAASPYCEGPLRQAQR